MRENAIIFGGEGFLGSHLVIELAKKYNIIIAGNFSRNSISLLTNRKEENKEFWEINENICCHKFDVVNDDCYDFLISYNPLIVINCSGIAGVSRYSKIPVETITTNAIGTYNIIKACNEYNQNVFAYKCSKINKIIIMSTSEVYGNSNSCIEDNEKICGEILSLPIYPELTDEHIEYVCNCIKKWESEQKK